MRTHIDAISHDLRGLIEHFRAMMTEVREMQNVAHMTPPFGRTRGNNQDEEQYTQERGRSSRNDRDEIGGWPVRGARWSRTGSGGVARCKDIDIRVMMMPVEDNGHQGSQRRNSV